MKQVMQQLLEQKASRSNEAAAKIALSDTNLDPWLGA